MIKRISIGKKKSQEEMVGFGLIVVIVAVIILVFLFFVLKGKENFQESYEINSFVQSMLRYTTDCEDNQGYLRIERLISRCVENERCTDGRNSCEVLNKTLDLIMKQAWKVKDRPEKGYSILINSEKGLVTNLEEGNLTNNFGYGVQNLGRHKISINLKVYY